MKRLCIKFTVPGNPVGKMRPRFVRFAHQRPYTPEKTRTFEAAVAHEFWKACGAPPIRPRLGRSLSFKGKQPIMQADRVYVRCYFRNRANPDGDNVLKSVLDGLIGLAYTDDRHVGSAVFPCWDDPKNPRIEVTVIQNNQAGGGDALPDK